MTLRKSWVECNSTNFFSFMRNELVRFQSVEAYKDLLERLTNLSHLYNEVSPDFTDGKARFFLTQMTLITESFRGLYNCVYTESSLNRDWHYTLSLKSVELLEDLICKVDYNIGGGAGDEESIAW